MVKVSRRYHIRKTGCGRGKVRRNPRPKRRILRAGMEPSHLGGNIVDTTYMENHSYDEIQHHKFYKVVLVHTTRGYYVFTNWGRVGTTGQAATDGPISDRDDAYAKFQKVVDTKRGRGYF